MYGRIYCLLLLLHWRILMPEWTQLHWSLVFKRFSTWGQFVDYPTYQRVVLKFWILFIYFVIIYGPDGPKSSKRMVTNSFQLMLTFAQTWNDCNAQTGRWVISIRFLHSKSTAATAYPNARGQNTMWQQLLGWYLIMMLSSSIWRLNHCPICRK